MNSLNRLGLLFVFLALFSCAEKGNSQQSKKVTEELEPLSSTIKAPEINTEFGWLNSDKAYSINDFKGKIVILDFWTFGCINCQHIVPDLKRLEKEFPTELVVIGVHSAKFSAEKSNATIKKAILKFGVEHPVVNDANFEVWNNYGVQAWPTVALIDPKGFVIGTRSGEGVYEAIQPLVQQLANQYKGQLNTQIFNFRLEKTKEPVSTLKFPSKIIKSEDGHIWISDSGNNRILKLDKNGKIILQIGSGKEGNALGSFSEAAFYEPHGLVQKGDLLYIADTKNNQIKVANLKEMKVSLFAGSGAMGYYFRSDKVNTKVDPNSPWDLLPLPDGNIMVANAGNHQILKLDINKKGAFRFAGSGREALTDGKLLEAAFNQPSGLTLIGNSVYVADAEASAIRKIEYPSGKVSTLIGKGLFDFGDKDGAFSEAVLQHPVGITALNKNTLLIADTYNGKIKKADLSTQKVITLASGFDEPNGILVIDENTILITDTNNNALWKINLLTGAKEKWEVSK